MYTPTDLDQISRQLQRRIWVLAIPAGALVIGMIISLLPTLRLEWLTVLLTILLGILLIAGIGLFIAPVAAYRNHLRSMLTGRSHVTDGLFKSLKQDPCHREGVTFYPMIVSVGDPANEDDDRLYYWDAEKPLPCLAVSDKVRITYHDKSVVHLERI